MSRSVWSVVSTALAAVLVSPSGGSASAAPAPDAVRVQPVSVRPNGNPAGMFAGYPTLSRDGQTAVFVSDAHLLPIRGLLYDQLYAYQRRTDRMVLLSATSAGKPTDGGDVFSYAVTPDGGQVAFTADGPDLVPAGKTPTQFVFVKDVTTGRLEVDQLPLVPKPGGGHARPTTTGALFVRISADGRYVALTAGTPAVMGGYLLDRRSHQWISMCGLQDCQLLDLTADGQYAVVDRFDPNYSPYLYDHRTASLIPLPGRPTPDSRVIGAQFAGNGHSVVVSWSTPVPSDPFGITVTAVQVNLPDRSIRRTVAFHGFAAVNAVDESGTRWAIDISRSGRVSPEAAYDAFRYDAATGTSTLLNVTPTGTRGNGASGATGISGDGREVLFYSHASDLVPNDRKATTAFIATVR